MKNLIITLLSVLALSMAFTGCGDSAGSVTDGSGTVDDGNELVVDNGDTTNTTITNEFGINPDLGTPPPLPAS